METLTMSLIGAIGALIFIMFAIYALIGKWISFGLKDFMANSKYKQHKGYMMIRDSGNNFDLPEIIDMREHKAKINKDDTFLFARDQLLGTTLYGRPFVMFDNDDNKTSLGLYYHNSEADDEATPSFYKKKDGNYLTDSKGERVPNLTQIKPAISTPPSFYLSLVDQDTFRNLRKYINEFMVRYKYVFIIIAAIGIGIGGLLYMQYELQEKFIELTSQCIKTVVAK